MPAFVDPVDGRGDRDEPVRGVSELAALGLRPHQVAPFKLSPGSEFIDKVFDSQGLHTIGGSAGSVAV
jgi:hypothetical protein